MAQKIQKINLMLSNGEPLLASYLKEKGFSSQLLSRYVKSGWLEMHYKGVYVKPKTHITLGGLLNTLITQKNMLMHISGIDALRLFGYFEQMHFANKSVLVYASKRIFLPKWVKECEKHEKISVKLVCSNLFPDEMFTNKIEYDGFGIPASIPERAVFEALNEVKTSDEYFDFLKVFEMIANLKSDYLETLMTKCNSIKVKRMFLYVSHLMDKPYFEKLKLNKYELGTGVRTLFTAESKLEYDARYKIMVPKARQS